MEGNIITEEGFMRMYEAFYDKIYNYVFFQLLNAPDTEDLVSEIFLRAFSSRASYDGTRASQITWLFTIAKNILVDYSRKNKTPHPLELSEALGAADPGIGPEEACMVKGHYERALGILHTLRDTDRAIIYLRCFSGMSYSEIAGHLNMSEKNVSVKLSRARKKLRERFKALEKSEGADTYVVWEPKITSNATGTKE